MDPHQYQCSSNGGRSSSFLCRQSSSRWIPTAEQIRILRELYYTNGVRSPTAEQIQRISARLRQYGKIEGKNVFYWFQNHKARERQKKKLTMDTSANNSSTITNTNATDIGAYCIGDHNKLSNANSVVNVPYGLSAASHGIYDVGNGYGAGGAPMLMETSIRESRLSGGQGGGDGSAVESNNMPRMLIEPTVPWMYPHYIKEQEEPITAAIRQIETLPLFPTHSEEQDEDQEEEEEEQEQQEKYYSNSNNDYFTPPPTAANGHPPAAYYHHHYTVNGAGTAASLELTLNSYYCAPPGSM